MTNSIFPLTISKYATMLLLCGYLFLGVSHIALLPPWEGFDENAHFSSIQQITDTGYIPKLNIAKMSKDIDEYMLYAPMPYCYIPHFKEGEGFTYHTYFGSPSRIIQNGYTNIHAAPETPRNYRPGRTINWQAQHPPLYYALLSPIFSLTRSSSLFSQIFWLRLASYMLAWSALVITVLGGYYLAPSQDDSGRFALKHWMVVGTLSIPVFFPSWYPAMARIGNDSLCALLLAVLWVLFLRIYTAGKTYRLSTLLGFIMGLGCLTKAFFVPLSAGVIFYLLLHDVLRDGGAKKTDFLCTFTAILVLLTVSGWWFLNNWLEGGSLLGSQEVNILNDSGGLIANLQQYFSVEDWLRGHAAMIATIGWSCTWSFLRPPYIFMLPLAIAVVFFTVSYLSTLPRHKIHTLAWAPFWFALPVIAGLSYHVLVKIAQNSGGSGTGGYYLLFLVPIIGSAIGFSLGTFWHKKPFKFVTILFGIYAVLFAMVISWVQVMMFAGIIYASDDNRFYQFPDRFPSGFGIPDALTNLSTLVYPKLGMLCWLVGGVLLMAGFIIVWRSNHTASVD